MALRPSPVTKPWPPGHDWIDQWGRFYGGIAEVCVDEEEEARRPASDISHGRYRGTRFHGRGFSAVDRVTNDRGTSVTRDVLGVIA